MKTSGSRKMRKEIFQKIAGAHNLLKRNIQADLFIEKGMDIN